MRKLVCFFLGDRELAAPIEAVRETVGLRPITPVFRAPGAIAGITNLRGEILAVLDPAVLLGLPASRRGVSARILVVEPDHRAAGLLVDGLGTIRDVEEEAIQPVPPNLSAAVASMLEGIVSLAERSIGVLAVGRLLSAPELAPYARPSREGAEEPQRNLPSETEAT